MQFVILSDLHLVRPGAPLFGLEPQANLARAVEVIGRDHPGIAFVLLLGDLAHFGEAEAYIGLAETVARLRVPVIPLTGNHDSRQVLCAELPWADRDPAGFVQAVRVYEDASVLTLDTLDEAGGTAAGHLCAERLAFLERALTEAPADRPLLLFQHHPPFDTGIQGMDAIKLTNWQAEWDLFLRIRRPDYLFVGHVHRPVSGVWRGIPFHIQRGVSHQVGFAFETPDGVPGSHEEPDYALVEAGAEGVVIHQRPFRFAGPEFLLNDPVAERATRLN